MGVEKRDGKGMGKGSKVRKIKEREKFPFI